MNAKLQILLDKLKTPKGKKILILIILISIFLIIGGISIYNRYYKKQIKEQVPKDASIAVNETKIEEKVASKLDGLSYNKDIANRHPIAIIVENHTESRPHIGLNKASIIYEAEAEGGITRFLAIYGPNDADKVGPVRSARTYFLDWTLEYDAFFAHCGGNMDALDLIPQIGIKDLDQFTYGTQAYWREAENKAIEHTMYTDTNKLRDISKNNGWDVSTSDFESLKFKKDIELDKRPDSYIVNIDFSNPSFYVSWIYEKESNQYLRKMGGEEHIDRITKETLKAKNIIIQEVSRRITTTRINETGWIMDTVGSGSAFVVLDGKKIDATWKKISRNERTKFYDPEGKEIELNKGVTWYEIVPSLSDASF